MRSRKRGERGAAENIFGGEILLKLRREHAALRTGKLFHVFSDDELYLFVRQNDEERLLVVFNNSTKTQALNIAQPKTPLADALRSRCCTERDL